MLNTFEYTLILTKKKLQRGGKKLFVYKYMSSAPSDSEFDSYMRVLDSHCLLSVLKEHKQFYTKNFP